MAPQKKMATFTAAKGTVMVPAFSLSGEAMDRQSEEKGAVRKQNETDSISSGELEELLVKYNPVN